MIDFDLQEEVSFLLNLFKEDCNIMATYFENYYIDYDMRFISDILRNLQRNIELLFRKKCMSDRQIQSIVNKNNELFNIIYDIDCHNAVETIETHISLMKKYIKKSIVEEVYEVSYNLNRYLYLLESNGGT
ncbi:hypothetical protein UFOVP695_35 [uncultured Caudovirales phage]|uniref:Uncharacterized protein n=1 Tax=uncultured Caudovirales phage TaxID=2100421 RepID=A0A6J5NHG9_9CAUD|nr:hypothetical protein UFOVP695_35 [uncultured Caudovirales phage]